MSLADGGGQHAPAISTMLYSSTSPGTRFAASERTSGRGISTTRRVRCRTASDSGSTTPYRRPRKQAREASAVFRSEKRSLPLPASGHASKVLCVRSGPLAEVRGANDREKGRGSAAHAGRKDQKWRSDTPRWYSGALGVCGGVVLEHIRRLIGHASQSIARGSAPSLARTGALSHSGRMRSARSWSR